jgi:hypothetical protein
MKMKQPSLWPVKSSDKVGITRFFALFFLGGCAISTGPCRYSDDAEVTSTSSAALLPPGCRVKGNQSEIAQSIVCVDGRQGFVVKTMLAGER